MVSRETILKKLSGTAPPPRLIVDDQSVDDIIKQMEKKTAATAGDYDLIYKYFEGGSLLEICERLFDWCLDNIEVFTESEKKQFVSCPYTILQRGTSDCKGYALFIGGILDAMKRHGANLDWNYRFTSYNLLDPERNHVFVVVNKNTDNIWIDPVLGEFNYHLGYWYKTDKKPKSAAIGRVGDLGIFQITQNLINQDMDRSYAVISSFAEAGKGLALPSIPGYPPDLPQLQLSPTGRLCFYNWPEYFSSSQWKDLATMKPLATKLYTGDWEGSWLRILTPNRIPSSLFIDAAESQLYGEGRPAHWIFANIQYYIDKYLGSPYDVHELIPYGTNWVDQFKAAIMGGAGKLKSYLDGCSFLVQPVGSQGFWDKFYLAAPLVISAIAAVVTEGAATPALLLALTNLGIKYGEAKAATDSKTALPQQGAPQINTTAIQTDINTLHPQTAVQKVTAWVEAHKGLSIAIALLAVWLIYENDN